MRTARFLASIAAPILIVACAVGTAPVDTTEGEGTDAGTTSADGNYGTTGDSSPTQAEDSGGSTNEDGGTAKDGGTVVDSGTPVGTAGLDCSGSTSGSGESYDSECDDEYSEGQESDCSKGGGQCGAGTCCRSSSECNGTTFFGLIQTGDFPAPQCVPK
jgi:hypothetical protein